MSSKNFSIVILVLICLLLTLTGCGKKAEKEKITPTPEIYMPTRSVATVPVPTEVSTCINYASVLDDITVSDGSVLAPGEKFLKEWEVINYSNCNWDENYHLFFISGDQMGAPDFVDVPQIPIGSRGMISIEMTAPEEPGEYRSEWKLFGADNRFFGESMIVEIIVRDPDQNYYYYY